MSNEEGWIQALKMVAQMVDRSANFLRVRHKSFRLHRRVHDEPPPPEPIPSLREQSRSYAADATPSFPNKPEQKHPSQSDRCSLQGLEQDSHPHRASPSRLTPVPLPSAPGSADT